jgi:hypothetical protein
MLECPRCTVVIPEVSEKCLTCGYYAGPPNVRAAQLPEELAALEERYQNCLLTARSNGSIATLERFSKAVEASTAVINVDAEFLFSFVNNRNALYANYEHGVSGHLRKPAEFPHDVTRRTVGSILFGGNAGEIIYAALSLTNFGPQSYGPYALTLKEVAISERATVLENNSFDFVRKHELVPGDSRPPGFVATWRDRSKLAVAKLASYISAETTNDEFESLIMSSTGNRGTDELLEVHVFGTFDINAIASVKGNSRSGSGDARDLVRMSKQHLSEMDIPWIEND